MHSAAILIEPTDKTVLWLSGEGRISIGHRGGNRSDEASAPGGKMWRWRRRRSKKSLCGNKLFDGSPNVRVIRTLLSL